MKLVRFYATEKGESRFQEVELPINQADPFGEAVAFLESDTASFVTGATLPVSGGGELKIFGGYA